MVTSLRDDDSLEWTVPIEWLAIAAAVGVSATLSGCACVVEYTFIDMGLAVLTILFGLLGLLGGMLHQVVCLLPQYWILEPPGGTADFSMNTLASSSVLAALQPCLAVDRPAMYAMMTGRMAS